MVLSVKYARLSNALSNGEIHFPAFVKVATVNDGCSVAVGVVRVKKVLTMNEYEIAYKVKINRVFKVRIVRVAQRDVTVKRPSRGVI